MTWFKVDDTLAFHPKVMQAGNPAMGLWVRAGSWASQQLTDGYVPDDVARTLGSRAEIGRLVDSGLWLPGVTGGFQFHQWNEGGRQPKRNDVEARREADRQRKAAARAAAAAKRAAEERERLLSEGSPS